MSEVARRLLSLTLLFFLSSAAKAIDPACAQLDLLARPTIDVAREFTRVEGLGKDAPVALIAKKEQRDTALNQARKSDKVEGISDNRKVYPGFVGLGSIGHLGELGTEGWKASAEMPHGFAYGKDFSVISSTGKLLIVDSRTGKVRETIEDPHFKSLHTVEFRPGNPDVVLLASSGNNMIYEYDLKARKILWQWSADEHGFNTNNWGAHFVPKGTSIPDKPGVRKLSYDEAKALAQKGTKIPPGEEWYVEYEPRHREGPVGQERWARTAYPNWAGYGHTPDEILVTIYATGDVLKIDRATGKHEVLRSGLYRPHGVVAYEGGFVISDTRHGRVELLDKDYHLVKAFDFSTLPFSAGTKDLGWEWIQHTNPIAHGLLATIDSRRSKVYVWDPNTLHYSEYPLNPNWEVQSITQLPQ